MLALGVYLKARNLSMQKRVFHEQYNTLREETVHSNISYTRKKPKSHVVKNRPKRSTWTMSTRARVESTRADEKMGPGAMRSSSDMRRLRMRQGTTVHQHRPHYWYLQFPIVTKIEWVLYEHRKISDTIVSMYSDRHICCAVDPTNLISETAKLRSEQKVQ